MGAEPLQQLTPLEIHSGIAFGPWRGPAAPAVPDSPGHPRAAIDALLRDALSDPPCYVLFSGGRDSSVMLAAAVHVARRDGLPEPIALTARFPEFPTTWEDDWQERTIRHLGVEDWQRASITTDFDTLGAVATDSIRRFGVYWPSSAHNIRHFARLAGSGTLVTGGGGDELFTPWPLRRVPVKRLLKRRPRRRLARQVLVHQLPGTLRRRALRRRLRTVLPVPWLREEALTELRERWAAEGGARADSWGEAVLGMPRGRYRQLVGSAMQACAGAEGARLVEPFYDVRVIAAVAGHGPREGFPSRGRGLEAFFSDLLPRDVLYRSTKAHFNSAFFGPGAQAFARDWDGTGLDEQIVDPERLREEWAKERPSARSIASLHQAWLAAQPG